MDALKELKNFDKDDVLGALGLQAKRNAAEYIMPVLGVFGAGLLVGVGVGLLMAPKSGRELRQDLGRQVNSVRERATSEISEAADAVSAH